MTDAWLLKAQWHSGRGGGGKNESRDGSEMAKWRSAGGKKCLRKLNRASSLCVVPSGSLSRLLPKCKVSRVESETEVGTATEQERGDNTLLSVPVFCHLQLWERLPAEANLCFQGASECRRLCFSTTVVSC